MTTNLTPPAVRAVLDKPGKYLFLGPTQFLFEIDDERQVHQLDLHTLDRDGVLEPEGWSPRRSTQSARVFRLEEVLPDAP